MQIHVVHGILDPVGKAGLLGLVPYLQAAGFKTRVPDYGLITACETKIVNPLIWRSLRPYVEPGDIYIGHSNGCAIGYDLVLDGAALGGLVLIDGALTREVHLPRGVWADVYFNAGDVVTQAAEVAAGLGIAASDWGDMGHAGYQGDDPLITNIDCGKPPAGMPSVSGHSDIFTKSKLNFWAPFIVARLLEHGVKP